MAKQAQRHGSIAVDDAEHERPAAPPEGAVDASVVREGSPPPQCVRLVEVGKTYTASQGGADRGLWARLRGAGRGVPVVALERVNLDLYPGEFVCLAGPSGSGKTTLLNLIGGLISPTRGHILVDGKPVGGPGPDRGMVFQNPALFPWLTALENVEFGLRNVGVPPAERRRRARGLIALVRLEGFESKYPPELSLGTQQRVGIARALALDPDVLLLDEPFGSLDILSREHLQDEMQRLYQIRPRTTLFVTHDIEEALYLGDRLVILAGRPGRLVGDIVVPFARPRDQQLKTSVEFQRLRRDVKALIRRVDADGVPLSLPSADVVAAQQLDFASSVSHELRTPLTSIMALSEFLMGQEQPPEVVQELARDIHAESRRIERIAADLLDVSLLDTGRLDLATKPTAVAELIRPAVSSPAIAAAERSVEVVIEEGLPAVRADAARVRQVIHNLLLNAFAYSPPTSAVQVLARRGHGPRDVAGEEGWPVIEVADRGIGIPEGELQRVFDKFYRASNAVVCRPTGTGLGLFLARRIVELHGGRIWAAPRPGGGTIVGFTLPPV